MLIYKLTKIKIQIYSKKSLISTSFIRWEPADSICILFGSVFRLRHRGFSSNKGKDFKAVLDSVCSVKDETADVPMPTKWEQAGEILGNDYSVAWRVLDAQYWGVPQRRKRIYLVADFTGQRAGNILCESDGVSGYLEKSRRSWKATAADAESCSGEASGLCLNDQGGSRMDITDGVTSTLRAQAHHPPIVTESAGFCTEHSAKARSVGFEKEKSPTLRAGTVPAAVFENHSQDSRYTGPHDVSQTVLSTFGTGGNNQPFVVEDKKAFDVRLTSLGTRNIRANIYETDTARTIDTGGNSPANNQGGVAVVSIQGSMIGRKDENGPQGSGVNEDVSFTLDSADRHAVAYGIDRATYNMGQNAKFDISIKKELEPSMVAKGPGAVAHPVYSTSKNSYHTFAEEDKVNTLVATDYKDPPTACEEPYYIVRRLTPTECARLQGFPDWWCSDLGTEKPTDEEMYFWYKVFETWRQTVNPDGKPKSSNQIRKWLKNPYSDSAEYKLWGNGVCLNNVVFVLSGIVYFHNNAGDVYVD